MTPERQIVGPIELDRAGMVLRGPSGRIPLSSRPFRVLDRLMTRPGAIVTRSDVISAMYDDPDDEAAEAATIARQQIERLRRSLVQVGADGQVEIRTAVGVGYAIEVKAGPCGTR